VEFVTTNLRARLLDEMATAVRVDIAVAYFCPEPATLAALQAVPRLRLLVSNCYQINNPDNLEALHKNNKWVRAILPEAHGGNLHAKVYIITRKDNSVWAMVGSANLTRSGLTSNQEACIILDSSDRTDALQLRIVQEWYDDLCSHDLPEIDFDLARAIFESKTARQPNRTKQKTGSTGYWAMKPGHTGEFWDHWRAESIISIGWRQLPDTSELNRLEAEEAYLAARPEDTERQAKTNVPQILNFTQSMQPGDLVLICGRFDGIGDIDSPVHIYAVARTVEINGKCYFFDTKSKWHRCKRNARMQYIEKSLPRSLEHFAFPSSAASLGRV
jgi:PLD-like domain